MSASKRKRARNTGDMELDFQNFQVDVAGRLSAVEVAQRGFTDTLNANHSALVAQMDNGYALIQEQLKPLAALAAKVESHDKDLVWVRGVRRGALAVWALIIALFGLKTRDKAF